MSSLHANLPYETPLPQPGLLDASATDPAAAEQPYIPNCDLHNHTVFSGHSDDDATLLNLISRASSLNLDFLGISEHVMQLSDVSRLQAIHAELQTLTSMGCQPLFGVEMDVDPTDPDGRWVVPDVQCDYVILSAHGFPQFDLDIPESDKYLPAEDQRKHLAARWLNWYGNAVRRGGFHIMGHPLREALIMNLVDLNDPELMEMSLAALRPAIHHNIAFELNNAFLAALEMSVQYDPYVVLVRRLRDAGMKFARGSDSHGVIRVGAHESVSNMAEDAQLRPEDWYNVFSIKRQ